MITDLWLARHGESIGNVAATTAEIEGLEAIAIEERDADVPLSATGMEQARALGTWLEPHAPAIGAAWVSPYVRARETLALAIAEAGVGIVPLTDERLRDRELGVLDLLTRRGVERLHPGEAERRRRLGKYYHRPPGGESWVDLRLRLRSFLSDALPTSEGGTLIVAHDAVVMLLISLLTAMSEEELLAFAAANTVLNASVTHLSRDGAQWEVRTFSDVAHLQREGADVTVHPGSPDVEPR
ncbi:histidine phosphatase family protein [Microbacterium hominis]|uniref:histidine phosphatase family protein n=1 Tax=Microbacterium hominis TaxID=162426 RepID=UPI00168AA22D|nr:histidine phosphatase family protein [Microbacterium hominis]QOC25166.1 histidine phosphatase family protein [Microbacterium hominis]QOC29201.1 histidine phosphatase family protein [Microbacterium hominis]